MATVLAYDVVARAGIILQDTTKVRWPEEELANWLTDGQREVVLVCSQACVTNASVQLTASKTKQTLPSSGIMLIDITRNMGADGGTPGKAIRLVAREVMDAQNKDWHTVSASTDGPAHFMYDPRDPKTYYVYPKAPATPWYVELVYSSAPSAVQLTGVTPNKTISNPSTQTIAIDDIYSNALVDYILYRAYSKDAEYAGNAQRAIAHYTAFTNALGVKTTNEMRHNPNLTTAPFNPNVPGSARV